MLLLPSFVDIVIDGQRQLGLLPSFVGHCCQLGFLPSLTPLSTASDSWASFLRQTSSSTASVSWASFLCQTSSSTASVSWASFFPLLTLLLTASVSWASFLPSSDIVVDGQRQLGFLPSFVDIVVDGQRELGFLPTEWHMKKELPGLRKQRISQTTMHSSSTYLFTHRTPPRHTSNPFGKPNFDFWQVSGILPLNVHP